MDDRLIVGVDGLSRSGKTTLVNELSQYLKKENTPFHIFHIDDHIVEREKRYDTGQEEWHEYYFLQWDIEWLTHHFFERLKTTDQITLPFYEDKIDTQRFQNIKLPDEGVIVVEGVFLQRKEWRRFFDHMIFLNCPRDVRFRRESEGTQRNVAKFENRYWKAEDYYLRTEAPLENADVVLKG
ncbi:kinase [Alkalihalobacillus sp. AL-G]|nr:kinase [Alkalihalobacillus sp. AL-G]